MEVSAFGAHVSLPSSSRRKWVLTTHASPRPSSCRQQVSHIQAPEVAEVTKSLKVPQALEVLDASQEQEATEATQEQEALEGFGGGSSNMSFPPFYPNHTSRHVWDEEVKFSLIHSL